jgi:hypothetical protein
MWYSTDTVLALYRSMQADRERRIRPLVRRRRRVGTRHEIMTAAVMAATR